MPIAIVMEYSLSSENASVAQTVMRVLRDVPRFDSEESNEKEAY